MGRARDRRRGWLTWKLRMLSQGKNTGNGEGGRRKRRGRGDGYGHKT
jgi:hypothetical protein